MIHFGRWSLGALTSKNQETRSPRNHGLLILAGIYWDPDQDNNKTTSPTQRISYNYISLMVVFDPYEEIGRLLPVGVSGELFSSPGV